MINHIKIYFNAYSEAFWKQLILGSETVTLLTKYF